MTSTASGSVRGALNSPLLLGFIGFLVGLVLPIFSLRLSLSFIPITCASILLFSSGLICKSEFLRRIYSGIWRGTLVSLVLGGSMVLRTKAISEIKSQQAP